MDQILDWIIFVISLITVHLTVQCLNLLNLTKTFFELLRLNNGLIHGLNQLDIMDYVLD